MTGFHTGNAAKRLPHAERAHDLYETPSAMPLVLLERITLPRRIWEPAAGLGAISDVLKAHGHDVVSTDLVDHGGHGITSGVDFLKATEMPEACGAIVTNPPYMAAERFIRHARDLSPVVCFFLRLAFLEGLRWTKGLQDGFSHLVIPVPRPPMIHRPGYEGPRLKNSGTAFGWFCWTEGHQGPPVVEHVAWKKMEGAA